MAVREMTVDPARQRGRAAGLGSAHDRVLLLKPRVMSLVVFTGAVGFIAAPGTVDPLMIAVTLLCMGAGAGACGALNMWYDADIDALMTRTATRPIPRGVVSKGEALLWGSLLAALSVLTLGLNVNWTAGGLLALTIGIYVFIYTMGLKRRTAQNIVIGGASGALPPVIGWAAQTGVVEAPALAMFAIIFLWTPVHFWALAIARKADYERAGVPMLPVVAGNRRTTSHILAYALALMAATYLPVMLGSEGALYGAIVTGLNAELLHRAISLWRSAKASDAVGPDAMRLFGYSILYLFVVFIGLLAGTQ